MRYTHYLNYTKNKPADCKTHTIMKLPFVRVKQIVLKENGFLYRNLCRFHQNQLKLCSFKLIGHSPEYYLSIQIQFQPANCYDTHKKEPFKGRTDRQKTDGQVTARKLSKQGPIGSGWKPLRKKLQNYLFFKQH